MTAGTQVVRLRAALAVALTYVRHTESCAYWRGEHRGCTCALAGVIARAEQALKSVKVRAGGRRRD